MIDLKGKTYAQITKLNLSGKKLKKIPEEVFNCKNLTKLILSKNEILVIPQKINELKKLKVLDLSYNRVKEVKANVFKLPKLTTLNLSHNELKTIPSQLKDSNIRTLLVQNNKIHSWHWSDTIKLKKLNISNNLLEEVIIMENIDRMLCAELSIESLWFNNNPLKRIVIYRCYLPNLKRIYGYTEFKLMNSLDIYNSFAKIKNNAIEFARKNFPFTPVEQTNKIINNIMKTNEKENELEEKLDIFISYSHADSEWLSLLNTHLKALSKKYNKIEPWDDTKLQAGVKWKEEIEKALSKSKIAILLVSKNFLASDFIQSEEVPKILKNASENGTMVFPVIIAPCLFEDFVEISQYQAINSPSKTLSECEGPERDRYMLNLMKAIKEQLS